MIECSNCHKEIDPELAIKHNHSGLCCECQNNKLADDVLNPAPNEITHDRQIRNDFLRR